MGEIKGNLACRAKAKASMGRDDRGKGKAVSMVTSPPAPGKKKLEGPGGKGPLLPHAKPQTQSVTRSVSVEVEEKSSVSSSTKAITKTTKKTTTVIVKEEKTVYTRNG